MAGRQALDIRAAALQFLTRWAGGFAPLPLTLLARCPEPRLGPETSAQAALAEDIGRFARQVQQAGVQSAFGMELRAAFLLEMEGAARPEIPDGAPPYRQFFLRPAVEPILYSYLGALRKQPLDTGVLDGLMACLHGRPVERRDIASRIKPNAIGNIVLFPDPDYARDYHLRLDRHLPSISGAINRAGFAFPEIVLSHPYSDGNGRLARAMAQIGLTDGEDAALSFMPLGPLFYARASEIAGALQALAATADWQEFMAVFTDYVADALALAGRVLDQRLPEDMSDE
jgi:hypothetical protein